MREQRSLEYKRDISNSFLKTVSAFANFNGGVIKFGVTDNGEVIGIENPIKVSLDIENKINDNITPRPNFSISIDDESNVITLYVSKGEDTPYFYNGKAYRRSDTSSVPVDSLELRRLALEGSNLTYDALDIKDHTFTFKYLSKYFQDSLGIDEVSESILKTLGLITRDGKYTVAGALFADENKYFGIDIARFENINVILDRATYRGQSILEQYDSAVEKYKQYYQYDIIEKIQRETLSLVPEDAFREAVANALVHREWDVNAHIRIAMYPEYIKIFSPGGLPEGINQETFFTSFVSSLRNPIIGNVFYRLQLIEMFGTGINRIIKAYENLPKQPSFDITENAIVVTLPVNRGEVHLTINEQKVFDVLSNSLKLSTSEISRMVNLNKMTVLRVLKRLLEQHLIRVEGRGRGTKYYK